MKAQVNELAAGLTPRIFGALRARAAKRFREADALLDERRQELFDDGRAVLSRRADQRLARGIFLLEVERLAMSEGGGL
jgi:hypothetical protein